MPDRILVTDIAAPATGAAFGVVMLYSRLGARPPWQKFILLLSAFVGATFTGWAAAEFWSLSPAFSGAISWLAGNVALTVSETAVAILGDVPWIQRQLAALIPGKSKDEDNA
ncbi:MAG: hypothetical protein NT086_12390 [Proteobacteria bacterium]|uniref:hypothetical protein n=1 Tax=Janthinobacterium sp. B9-8 TaxID=1236179 RepID=UPI00061CEBD8|nr:hypothetical protein [Janthinobacterium sp. B9-8]AMC34720.1 hypothetical protein VN23_08920 [Janthinobacterium sp. B9-8]MCX7206756.1 hypothetical protein [Pseudomonadota bacterium]